jgi:hypothetical protein
VCPDLRGLGWSDAPPGAYAKEDRAADVVDLLDALGRDGVHLAGHDSRSRRRSPASSSCGGSRCSCAS